MRKKSLCLFFCVLFLPPHPLQARRLRKTATARKAQRINKVVSCLVVGGAFIAGMCVQQAIAARPPRPEVDLPPSSPGYGGPLLRHQLSQQPGSWKEERPNSRLLGWIDGLSQDEKRGNGAKAIPGCAVWYRVIAGISQKNRRTNAEEAFLAISKEKAEKLTFARWGDFHITGYFRSCAADQRFPIPLDLVQIILDYMGSQAAALLYRLTKSPHRIKAGHGQAVRSGFVAFFFGKPLHLVYFLG